MVVSISVGTAIMAMESVSVSFPKIKVTLRQIGRNERKKRGRSLDLAVRVLVLEGNNMNGGGSGCQSNQEDELKSSTIFGTCTVAGVVGGAVPISLVFIPPSLQIPLPFLLPCSSLILFTRR